VSDASLWRAERNPGVKESTLSAVRAYVNAQLNSFEPQYHGNSSHVLRPRRRITPTPSSHLGRHTTPFFIPGATRKLVELVYAPPRLNAASRYLRHAIMGKYSTDTIIRIFNFNRPHISTPLGEEQNERSVMPSLKDNHERSNSTYWQPKSYLPRVVHFDTSRCKLRDSGRANATEHSGVHGR
jgi:hypothetical protein